MAETQKMLHPLNYKFSLYRESNIYNLFYEKSIPRKYILEILDLIYLENVDEYG